MVRLRKSERDLVAVTVLALLLQGPRHTYEMHRLILDTHKDFVTGLPRSMYHAVERLVRDGLIESTGTSKDGNRPERITYRLTGEGRAELGSRVHRLLATPDADATLFHAALSFIGCLPVAGARAALGERVAGLEGQLTTAREQLKTLSVRLPRVLLVELEYEQSRIGAELDWTRGLLSDLDDDALSWPENLAELMPMPGDEPDEPGEKSE
ncbi:Transcriptional regulator PadR-like family protein [Streptomyces sp. YIM 130001]|uniref:PadR family transcriptional regulator n=1 Tax=Streptomyces sp. YIM 130001 TaxID=2259644 RepID=UPI000EE7FDDA|nr:PadR family transcriptional regulator [Streptomyces sp. YIM 130001]RII09200.1 Transcriptional regulator PadR-like family protein [Streptomyces sp. YIM 130001]